ncbi:MAG: LytR C-terminal domain-containing protein [Candidatus Pacebacteria bacterium]|nr:LytR C-terminal domain-containing protein [Candidatus Paceibacterota bacterium]
MKAKREKITQKKKKRRLFAGKLFLIAGGLILLVLGLVLFRFFHHSILPKEGRITIGLGPKPLVLVSYSKEEETLVFLLIPEKILLPAAYGYGQYRIEAFKRLAELTNRPSLLQESLSSSLALPLHGWIEQPHSLPEETTGRTLKKWFLEQIKEKLLGKGQTALFPLDLLRSWWLILRSPAAKIRVLTLAEDRGLRESVLPDGSFFWEFAEEETDQLVKEFFSEGQIKKEKIAIGIANATGKTGLAKKAARLVTNLGGSVVEVTDWPSSLTNSVLRIDPDREITFSIEKVARAFNCEIKRISPEPFAVDALMIVGEDFSQKIGFD